MGSIQDFFGGLAQDAEDVLIVVVVALVLWALFKFLIKYMFSGSKTVTRRAAATPPYPYYYGQYQ
jgi:hypothetical protein